jgi:hypothetical protein
MIAFTLLGSSPYSNTKPRLWESKVMVYELIGIRDNS